MVLHHESAGRFNALVQELTDEFSPQSGHQVFLVEQMAEARWRIERFQRIEAAAFERIIESGDPTLDPDARIAAHLVTNGAGALNAIQRILSAAQRTYDRFRKELSDARSDNVAFKTAMNIDAQLEKMSKIPHAAKSADQLPKSGPKFFVAPGENLALRL